MCTGQQLNDAEEAEALWGGGVLAAAAGTPTRGARRRARMPIHLTQP